MQPVNVTLTARVTDITRSFTLPTTVAVQAEGRSVTSKSKETIYIPASMQLLPTRITAEGYREKMSLRPSPFTHHSEDIPLLPAQVAAAEPVDGPVATSKSPLQETMALVLKLLPGFTIQRTDTAAILYSRTPKVSGIVRMAHCLQQHWLKHLSLFFRFTE